MDNSTLKNITKYCTWSRNKTTQSRGIVCYNDRYRYCTPLNISPQIIFKKCKNFVILHQVRYTQGQNNRPVVANYIQSISVLLNMIWTVNPTLECPILDCSVFLTRSTYNSQLRLLLADSSLSEVTVGNVQVGFPVFRFPLLFSSYQYALVISTLEICRPTRNEVHWSE